MKAMVLPKIAPIGERPLVARELPDPEPGEGEVRVRVRVCAICRTDLTTACCACRRTGSTARACSWWTRT